MDKIAAYNKLKRSQKNKEYYAKNPERYKHYRLKRYGIGLEEYKYLWSEQGGACKICETPFEISTRVSVDHNHKTGQVRGLLCNKCNVLIGMANDDTSILINAISYLKS